MYQDHHATFEPRSSFEHAKRRHRSGTKTVASSQQVSALTLLAHDLRGPLANIGLLLEAIASETEHGNNPLVAAKARHAELVAQRMAALLTSVLERARASCDPLEPRFETFNLERIVEAACRLNGPAAERAEVRVHTSSIARSFAIGDPQLILEVLDNLIGNAIKHSQAGGRIDCDVHLKDGLAIIAISDEGSGLTDEDVRRLFCPFTSLGRPSCGNQSSCGLGLWICRLIVDSHDGSIGAAPRTDRSGTVFTITIPAAP